MGEKLRACQAKVGDHALDRVAEWYAVISGRAVHSAPLSSLSHTGQSVELYRSFTEDVPLPEFLYLVLTRVSGESYRGRLMSVVVLVLRIFSAD